MARKKTRQYEWFPRLAAIAGVGYAGHPDIDRRKLPGQSAKPHVEVLSFGGEDHVSAMWSLPNGATTSQSPASAWAATEPNCSSSDVVRRVYEAMELPGQAADYHFALLQAYGKLWSFRRHEPQILPDFEALCLLDIALIEARPEIIIDGPGDSALRVPAFEYLIRLYEGEGFFRDALDIARRAADCGQSSDDEERLEALVHGEP